ncbi:chascon [Anaeramoeba flamelloides]|uniref:Chascon n=1 Tax=Anaeramoeba flamelloides TaxID=1746091 RepID=A0ABQ8XX98_9EUKA|nr:chascon [Anaeramoeba flamelloides]
MSLPVLLGDYLFRYSKRWKSKKKRYIVLKNHQLYDYKNEKDFKNKKRPSELVKLSGYACTKINLKKKKKAFYFELTHPSKVCLYFSCDDLKNGRKWMKKINLAIPENFNQIEKEHLHSKQIKAKIRQSTMPKPETNESKQPETNKSKQPEINQSKQPETNKEQNQPPKKIKNIKTQERIKSKTIPKEIPKTSQSQPPETKPHQKQQAHLNQKKKQNQLLNPKTSSDQPFYSTNQQSTQQNLKHTLLKTNLQKIQNFKQSQRLQSMSFAKRTTQKLFDYKNPNYENKFQIRNTQIIDKRELEKRFQQQETKIKQLKVKYLINKYKNKNKFLKSSSDVYLTNNDYKVFYIAMLSRLDPIMFSSDPCSIILSNSKIKISSLEQVNKTTTFQYSDIQNVRLTNSNGDDFKLVINLKGGDPIYLISLESSTIITLSTLITILSDEQSLKSWLHDGLSNEDDINKLYFQIIGKIFEFGIKLPQQFDQIVNYKNFVTSQTTFSLFLSKFSKERNFMSNFNNLKLELPILQTLISMFLLIAWRLPDPIFNLTIENFSTLYSENRSEEENIKDFLKLFLPLPEYIRQIVGSIFIICHLMLLEIDSPTFFDQLTSFIFNIVHFVEIKPDYDGDTLCNIIKSQTSYIELLILYSPVFFYDNWEYLKPFLFGREIKIEENHLLIRKSVEQYLKNNTPPNQQIGEEKQGLVSENQKSEQQNIENEFQKQEQQQIEEEKKRQLQIKQLEIQKKELQDLQRKHQLKEEKEKEKEKEKEREREKEKEKKREREIERERKHQKKEEKEKEREREIAMRRLKKSNKLKKKELKEEKEITEEEEEEEEEFIDLEVLMNEFSKSRSPQSNWPNYKNKPKINTLNDPGSDIETDEDKEISLIRELQIFFETPIPLPSPPSSLLENVSKGIIKKDKQLKIFESIFQEDFSEITNSEKYIEIFHKKNLKVNESKLLNIIDTLCFEMLLLNDEILENRRYFDIIYQLIDEKYAPPKKLSFPILKLLRIPFRMGYKSRARRTCKTVKFTNKGPKSNSLYNRLKK